MPAAKDRPFSDPAVAERFERYEPSVRQRLLGLRRLIFDVAARTEGVGELEEALRWDQPSYLTSATRSGSTVRLDAKGAAGDVAVFFICHTNLVDDFVALYPGTFTAERNRALIFAADDAIPGDELAHCLALALTYHARRRPKRGRPRKTKQA